MMVSRSSEKAMLRAVSTLLRLLRNAFLVTKRVRVMPASGLRPYGLGQRCASVRTAYLMRRAASITYTTGWRENFTAQWHVWAGLTKRCYVVRPRARRGERQMSQKSNVAAISRQTPQALSGQRFWCGRIREL